MPVGSINPAYSLHSKRLDSKLFHGLSDSQKGDGIFWDWLNRVAATASRAITLTQDFEVTKDAECRDVRRRRSKVTSSREDRRTVSLLCRAD